MDIMRIILVYPPPPGDSFQTEDIEKIRGRGLDTTRWGGSVRPGSRGATGGQRTLCWYVS